MLKYMAKFGFEMAKRGVISEIEARTFLAHARSHGEAVMSLVRRPTLRRFARM